MKVRITLNEEMLGMSPASKDVYRDFIASKSPDASTMEEEIEAVGVQEYEEKSMTVFPRDDEGTPIIWDYQIKGFFKDACQMLQRAAKSGYKGGKHCASIKAYKKAIDGNLFIFPRKIKIQMPENEKIGFCSRPLRAMTPKGERVSLAKSETVPAGSVIEFDIMLLGDDLEGMVKECLDYGEMRGLGQWRNSGKGVFSYEIVK